MKEITTLTVGQDRDEPRLRVRIYRENLNFYIRIESDHPAIPRSMPMRIKASNFNQAKEHAENFLRLVRGVFRQALGRSPDLPEQMTEIEGQMPAFLDFLLAKSSQGLN